MDTLQTLLLLYPFPPPWLSRCLLDIFYWGLRNRFYPVSNRLSKSLDTRRLPGFSDLCFSMVLRTVYDLRLFGMSKIYDIWFRAVVESESAKEVPGLNPEVFPNIQFTRMVDRNPAEFSDEFWKKVAEKLFQSQGVKVPEQGLDKEQEISITCRQLDGEQFRGEVEIPEEYTGENPYSVDDIY